MPLNGNCLFARIASLVCHREGERTFLIAERLLPLCARCTGIYAGFFMAFLFIWYTSARKKFLHFSKKASLFTSALFLVFLLEILFSGRTPLPGTNNIRFFSGILGGSSLGIFAFGVLNYSLRGKTYFGHANLSSKNLLILMLVMPALFFLSLIPDNLFIYRLWVALSITGLFFTYIAANLTVVSVFIADSRNKRGKKWHFKIVFYTAVLFVLSVLLLVIFSRRA